MTGAASASVRAARWLVGVLACVVLAFLGATFLAQYQEQAIAGRAEDIIGNAMPSVQQLSSVRGNLRALENALERYYRASPDVRGELRTQIDRERADIDAALATYLSLPFFPHERVLFSGVDRVRAQLDHTIDHYLQAPDDAGLAELHRECDELDPAIERVITFDATQGERLGRDIERIHGGARGLVMLLDFASVVLAGLAGVIALRQLRRATREHEAERRVVEARERELASQNAALGEFAGRVAHDVLSPLGTTQLALDIARPTCTDPIASRALDRGASALQRVRTLVDGLLAFSRAGGRPEPGAHVSLAAVIADVTPDLATQAKQHDIALVLAPVPDGDIACSAGVLTSLVHNLVRNSIKYMGDAKERRIGVRVLEAGAHWRVEVEDTGPGIAPEQQARIFEPYVQLSRGSSGIGLGLATVDRLVRAHGGAVGVSSRPGRGALFWFELPRWGDAAASLSSEFGPSSANLVEVHHG